MMLSREEAHGSSGALRVVPTPAADLTSIGRHRNQRRFWSDSDVEKNRSTESSRPHMYFMFLDCSTAASDPAGESTFCVRQTHCSQTGTCLSKSELTFKFQSSLCSSLLGRADYRFL
ncbi:hypothetical protein MPTK1_3g16300 [Marchantia polymorpha subsp. ruderalis]|uniref:Uncharacterized protein n=2 Tax=Marchantia polymorpha TaxID=3197 RepID=A0AAF6B1E0_MARPO|nr:hypothetical protein MARPO_0004s0041 [Marchantia polymorpha]BBN05824.1 hypothetical protein Mp_3g16300 [Marchantia polymorpha subsp. ruderalis]|eukprot:PTQ48753.1 hypothetical protein MARPO_0004s0041 [Marchantia polymorpha]